MPQDWQVLDINVNEEIVDGVIDVDIVPRSLCPNITIEISYDKSVQDESEVYNINIETSVVEKITLESGWNWISVISGEYWISEIGELLVEARSKSELVYNDPQWGFFGSLELLGVSEAYKVNMSQDMETSLDIYITNTVTSGDVEMKSLTKGWNWVSYPYEYSYGINEIFNASYLSEGDIILSKSGGFATIVDGVWEGTLDMLMPNEGYMLYINNANLQTLPMPNRYSLVQGEFTQPERAKQYGSVWQYDDSRFANTMAVIGKMDIEDCESYTIGAFVGDECRGEGKFINGKAYISVAGEAGEIVTFRLYNMWTGEFIDVVTEVAFADMIGSAKAPIFLGKVDGTTGIIDVNAIDADSIEGIYDISGRRVDNMTQGIYILKVREGDQIVTKKVRK